MDWYRDQGQVLLLGSSTPDSEAAKKINGSMDGKLTISNPLLPSTDSYEYTLRIILLEQYFRFSPYYQTLYSCVNGRMQSYMST